MNRDAQPTSVWKTWRAGVGALARRDADWVTGPNQARRLDTNRQPMNRHAPLARRVIQAPAGSINPFKARRCDAPRAD